MPQRAPPTDRAGNLGLRGRGEMLDLIIDEDGESRPGAAPMAPMEVDSKAPLASVQQLSILSGAEFAVAPNAAGGTTLRASWRCRPVPLAPESSP